MPLTPTLAGPIKRWKTAKPSLGTINANTTSIVNVTLAGVTPNSVVLCIPPADIETGLIIQAPCLCAKDTIKLRIANVTAGNITPAASQEFMFIEL